MVEDGSNRSIPCTALSSVAMSGTCFRLIQGERHAQHRQAVQDIVDHFCARDRHRLVVHDAADLAAILLPGIAGNAVLGQLKSAAPFPMLLRDKDLHIVAQPRLFLARHCGEGSDNLDDDPACGDTIKLISLIVEKRK
jgi:hypothetical protein